MPIFVVEFGKKHYLCHRKKRRDAGVVELARLESE